MTVINTVSLSDEPRYAKNSFLHMPIIKVYIIRIYHESWIWIDNSVPRVTVWHHGAPVIFC